MFGSLNPNDLGAAFQQLGQMLSYEGGPVNWDMAKQIARQTVSQGTPDGTKDESVGPAERTAVEEAVRLADLWLDGVTSLPSGAGSAVAWSRAEWVEATLPAWQQLVDPVAERVGLAMGDVLPEEMQAMAGPLIGMMRSMGGAMFGQQIGQAVGVLAGEVVGSTDIGLPLGPAGKAALLPLNIEAFGKDLGVPQGRGAAVSRPARGRPPAALRPCAVAALASVRRGRGLRARDQGRHQQAGGRGRPVRPARTPSSCRKPSSRACSSRRTPRSRRPRWPAWRPRSRSSRAGWTRWCTRPRRPRLTSADALRETLRRRRASGGPAEQTFATLIGLQLRPRRLRDASRLWASLTDARGVDGRDGLWEHPDMLPTAHDLDDPDGFVHREQLDFSELDKMLGEAARRRRSRSSTRATEGRRQGRRRGTSKDDTDK